MRPWHLPTTTIKQQTHHHQPARISVQYNPNPMEDLRYAKDTVAIFADHIDSLRPDEDRQPNHRPRSAELLSLSPTVKRHGSNNSNGSRKSSVKWVRSVRKEWTDSPTGTIWHHISNTLEEVAREQSVNATALKEFISSREILDLGAEFVRIYREKKYATQKPHWAAEDLFFDLQTVKQGDVPAARWTRMKPERRADWDLADYLARFVLSAEAHRRKAEREDWSAWDRDFESNACLYLGILRCFTLRDSKQREALRDRGGNTRAADRDSARQAKRTSRGSSGRLSFHSGKGGST
ncbi:hypothetical protein F4677DRAFT_433255 [Hypoxylon crocopeplum]|nr:hypothetical protein F4677DRAFT_433255 [Hypoxylon crocopeplum]